MLEWPRLVRWMLSALKEAEAARAEEETPVGVIVVNERTGSTVARAHHQTRRLRDATAHAAMIAMTQLAAWRGEVGEDEVFDAFESFEAHHEHKPDDPFAVVLTQEPCVMCAGAILLQPRVRRILYGARNPELGACGTVVDVFGNLRNGRSIEVVGGLLLAECNALWKR